MRLRLDADRHARRKRGRRQKAKVLSELIFGNPGNLRSNGKQLQYSQRHLQHARRLEEIKDVVERWLCME